MFKNWISMLPLILHEKFQYKKTKFVLFQNRLDFLVNSN